MVGVVPGENKRKVVYNKSCSNFTKNTMGGRICTLINFEDLGLELKSNSGYLLYILE